MHKTGSTSIQAFLDTYRGTLLELGIEFYSGLYSSRKHVELHAATMRPNRPSPFTIRTGLVPDNAFGLRIRNRVRDFVQRSKCHTCVFSAEGLSYLRHEDEMSRLRAFFPDEDVQIVTYHRKRKDFLASYAAEMRKHQLAEPIDRDSFAYVGADSWLLDYEDRIDRFRLVFNSTNVHTIDYDLEVRRRGNVIPSFTDFLGVGNLFSPEDCLPFFLNRGPRPFESPPPGIASGAD